MQFERGFGQEQPRSEDELSEKDDVKNKDESKDEIDPDEVFERVGKEIKEKEELNELREIISQWLEQQKPRIHERLLRFNVSEENISRLVEQISRDFLNDLRFASEEFIVIKDGLIKIKDRLKKTEEINNACDWLENASNLALYKLFNRKLKGETNEQDDVILALMNLVKHNGLAGQHVSLEETVSLSLFNEKNLDDYEKILDHELTHYGLDSAAPQATTIQLKGQQEIKKNKGEVSVAFAFSGLLTAINESAAHLTEDHQPEFNSYAEKVSPLVFKKVYQLIKQRVQGMDQSEKDNFFVDTYRQITAKWHDDMTLEEVTQIIVGL